jgi:DNA-binding MarR family transcriptional regulator
MSSDLTPGNSGGGLDMAPLEAGFAVLRTACDRAVDELGYAVPVAQQRALLIIDDADGSLDLRMLAAELACSPSAIGRLCDRMEAAGLLTTGRASASQAKPCCALTGSGRRLAGWIRHRQRLAVSRVLDSLAPEARDALVRGLIELAASTEGSSRYPETIRPSESGHLPRPKASGCP